MINPFESISNQLKRLEALLQENLKYLRNTPQPTERGGIELAQEVTRLSKARIYALVSAHAIPNTKRGNKLHFDRAELLAWVDQGKRAGKESF